MDLDDCDEDFYYALAQQREETRVPDDLSGLKGEFERRLVSNRADARITATNAWEDTFGMGGDWRSPEERRAHTKQIAHTKRIDDVKQKLRAARQHFWYCLTMFIATSTWLLLYARPYPFWAYAFLTTVFSGISGVGAISGHRDVCRRRAQLVLLEPAPAKLLP